MLNQSPNTILEGWCSQLPSNHPSIQFQDMGKYVLSKFAQYAYTQQTEIEVFTESVCHHVAQMMLGECDSKDENIQLLPKRHYMIFLQNLRDYMLYIGVLHPDDKQKMTDYIEFYFYPPLPIGKYSGLSE